MISLHCRSQKGGQHPVGAWQAASGCHLQAAGRAIYVGLGLMADSTWFLCLVHGGLVVLISQ